MRITSQVQILSAAALLCGAGLAQAQSTTRYDGDGLFARPAANSGSSYLPFTSEGYVGASVGRSDYDLNCVAGIPCDNRATGFKLFTGGQLFRVAGLDLAYVHMGSIDRVGGRARAQGVNLSAVANLPILNFNAFAKVGTTYGFTRSNARKEDGFGLSYGAGLQYNLSQKVAVRGEWDRMKFRFASGRDNVDLYTLGLVYRIN